MKLVRILAAAFTAILIPAHVVSASEVLSEQFRDTLMRLAQSGQLDEQAEPLVIERPAERVANLGLLVDRDDRQGLLVLGTMPGGSAEAMGLRGGDRLLEANGIDLRGAGAGERMRRLVELWDDEDELQISLLRDGREQSLSGPIQVFQLPSLRVELGATNAQTEERGVAGSTCARISTFPGASRSRSLFPVRVMAIEGRGAGDHRQDTFRIPVGQVTIRLAEQIDSSYFPPAVNTLRTRRGADTLHEYVLDAEPGVTYFLAAQLLRDRTERIVDGSYWRPVVWRQRAESCR